MMKSRLRPIAPIRGQPMDLLEVYPDHTDYIAASLV